MAGAILERQPEFFDRVSLPDNLLAPRQITAEPNLVSEAHYFRTGQVRGTRRF